MDHFALMRAFSVNNPAKKVRENNINKSVVSKLLVDEFEGLKNWDLLTAKP